MRYLLLLTLLPLVVGVVQKGVITLTTNKCHSVTLITRCVQDVTYLDITIKSSCGNYSFFFTKDVDTCPPHNIFPLLSMQYLVCHYKDVMYAHIDDGTYSLIFYNHNTLPITLSYVINAACDFIPSSVGSYYFKGVIIGGSITIVYLLIKERRRRSITTTGP